MNEHAGDADAALAALPAIAAAAGEDRYEICPAAVAQKELAAGRRAGARPLWHGDPGYPAALAGLEDAPPLLWLRGDPALLARPAVALVGARNASSLGLRMARALADGLGRAGLAVVSGLARGIDGAAHRAALETGTIAVVAGGIDVVYPRDHAALTEEIAATGLLLSEMPPGLQPQARHFPRRNRIISGLARAVVVVEAAAKSGSLITARDALDQGREVMAVPGHPFDARAAGCNMLIRDGAALVRGAEDVLAALGCLPGAGGAPTDAAAPAGRPAPATAPSRRAPEPAQALAPGAAARAGGAGRLSGAPTDPGTGGPRGRRADPPPDEGGPGRADAEAPAPDDRGEAGIAERILALLGPAPLAEDQLLRDLALPAQAVSGALLDLELDGRVQRQPGGLLARLA